MKRFGSGGPSREALGRLDLESVLVPGREVGLHDLWWTASLSGANVLLQLLQGTRLDVLADCLACSFLTSLLMNRILDRNVNAVIF